jgi:hypothetical protein
MDMAEEGQSSAPRKGPGREIYAMGYVRDTGTARGRGVFSTRDIEAGEIVEVCPVLVLAGGFKDLPMELRRAVFAWGELTGGPDANVIALGYGGIYNHANPANLKYDADAEARCMVFCAAQDIPAGTEMTINFNRLDGGTTSDDDSWFRAVGMTPYPK